MKNLFQRLPKNLPGEFFVNPMCINCGTCRKFAPDVFADEGTYSFVCQQPKDTKIQIRTMQALISCPVHAIQAETQKVPAAVLNSFPLEIENGIKLNGFNAESSYGADSYFIQSPTGNWLIDSPRFTPMLVKKFRQLGGVKYIFLTHRDDVADAQKYSQAFGSRRIIHKRDQIAQRDAEIILDGEDDFSIEDASIIFTPGHTEGHCVLLWQKKYLFTGDHLAWDEKADGLRAFRDACWFSWSEQILSVEKLGKLNELEWIMPGHGSRHKLSKGTFPRLVEKTVKWMSGLIG